MKQSNIFIAIACIVAAIVVCYVPKGYTAFEKLIVFGAIVSFAYAPKELLKDLEDEKKN